MRVEADLKLGGATSATPGQERVALMMKEISKRVGELEAAGMADIRRYQGADHEMLRTSLLFDAFRVEVRGGIESHLRGRMQRDRGTFADMDGAKQVGWLCQALAFDFP